MYFIILRILTYFNTTHNRTQGILSSVASNNTWYYKKGLLQLHVITDTFIVWQTAPDNDFIKSKHVLKTKFSLLVVVTENIEYGELYVCNGV
jgi:hypothetical protein